MAVSLSDSPPSQGPSCPVCYRDYSDSEPKLIPRILQCGHTYCSECLNKLLNTEQEEDDYQQIVLNVQYAGREWTTTRNFPRSPKDEIKCPTCKAINHVQNKDITSLTKNFALLGCYPQTTNKNKHFCKIHNHEKRIYCSDCMALICAYCQLYGEHKGHAFLVASEASKPSIKDLKTVKEGLMKDLENLTTGKNQVNSTISKLARTRRRSERTVRKYFNNAVGKLESQKKLLLSQIASWTGEQLFILNAQLDILAKSTKDLEALQSSCQSLVSGDPLDALTEHQKVEDNAKKLQTHIRSLSIQPLINPWMKARTGEPSDQMLGSLISNFKLTYNTDVSTEAEGAGEEEDGGRQSGDNESESSVDSLLHEMGLLSEDTQSGRPKTSTSEGRGRGGAGEKQFYSQETQTTRNQRTSMEGAVGSDMPHFTIGQDLNWVSSVNSFPTIGHQMMRPFNRRSSQLSDGSGSTSDADNNVQSLPDLPSYRIPERLRLIAHRRDRMETSTDDSDRELEHHRSHDLSSTGGGGAESVLDPSLEIRRHWEFLNNGQMIGSGVGLTTGDSSKEEDSVTNFHSLLYEPEARSAHSDDSSSPPPPPHQLQHSTSNDFSFPHNLALPINSHSEDDEVVFPQVFNWNRSRGDALRYSLLDSFEPNSDRDDTHSDMDDFEEEVES